MAWVCKNCGAKMEDDSMEFCSQCGVKLDKDAHMHRTMKCISCGNELPYGVDFCDICGARQVGGISSTDKVKCPVCGKEYDKGIEYCSACGSRITCDAGQDCFTSFSNSNSSPNFGRENTFFGVPNGMDMMQVRRPFEYWKIGLICSVQTWLLGWLFGIVLSLIFCEWQRLYDEGYKLYQSARVQDAHNAWQRAKTYKIMYFACLGACIFLKIIFILVALFVAGSGIADFYREFFMYNGGV